MKHKVSAPIIEAVGDGHLPEPFTKEGAMTKKIRWIGQRFMVKKPVLVRTVGIQS